MEAQEVRRLGGWLAVAERHRRKRLEDQLGGLAVERCAEARWEHREPQDVAVVGRMEAASGPEPLELGPLVAAETLASAAQTAERWDGG